MNIKHFTLKLIDKQNEYTNGKNIGFNGANTMLPIIY